MLLKAVFLCIVFATSYGALDECQKELAFRITNIYETGTTRFKFDYCQWLDDGGGYDAGFISGNTASGAILAVVERWAKIKPEDELNTLLPRLREVVGSSDVRGLEKLCDYWRAATKDSRFNRVQYDYATDGYYDPSQRHASEIGLTMPLARAQLYDANIEQGDGDDEFSLGGMIKTTINQVGMPVKGKQSEWLAAFLNVRIAALHKKGYGYTDYRVKSYQWALQHGQQKMQGKTVQVLENGLQQVVNVTCTGDFSN
ncbi:chitosanase [Acrasis kona]|uniref:Chitosanase n=1 Tax=Acrasis kona TaxID=1008807 RepID=A0AAW2ZK22_9EUKA